MISSLISLIDFALVIDMFYVCKLFIKWGKFACFLDAGNSPTYLSESCSSVRNDMKLSEYSEGGARYTVWKVLTVRSYGNKRNCIQILEQSLLNHHVCCFCGCENASLKRENVSMCIPKLCHVFYMQGSEMCRHLTLERYSNLSVLFSILIFSILCILALVLHSVTGLSTDILMPYIRIAFNFSCQ
jgi:hypothetical protein